jgi:fumarylacetoacetate (FAA) hydrolase family protein
MIRLFDDGFTLEDVRRAEITLTISGRDGFALEERGAVGSISRDPTELVGADDRRAPPVSGRRGALSRHALLALEGSRRAGMGFTHKEGDVVRIASPRSARW